MKALKPNAILRVFKRPRVFLPVIHTPTLQEALSSVEVAIEAGADGVILINQGMTVKAIMGDLLPRLPLLAGYPGMWTGLNALSYTPEEAVGLAALYGIDGVWSDDAGVDHRTADERYAAGSTFLETRNRHNWGGLYFGGTAFKTQTEVELADLAETARAAMGFVDVVTTSGRGTGVAAQLSKVRAIREAIGNHPMALASGVTPENVHQYLPYVDAYLVATGIGSDFGVLDPERTRALAEAIHGWAPGP